MGSTAGRAPKRKATEAAADSKTKAALAREAVTRKLWSSYRADPTDERRNTLVEAYQYLVRGLVRRLANRLPRSVDRGDLETAGNMGLIGAISAFDPARGVRFESYCEMRVRGALLDELRAQDWLPRPWRHRIEQHKRVRETLRAALGRRPADEDVAREMSMDLRDYQLLFGTGLPGAPSGSMPGLKETDDVAVALEVVADPRVDAPEERLTREEILRLVAQKLSEQEYRILYLKYWEDLPMREIGELLGLSESRICKIHGRLLARLKDRLRGHE